jgi:hypothetical protein
MLEVHAGPDWFHNEWTRLRLWLNAIGCSMCWTRDSRCTHR